MGGPLAQLRDATGAGVDPLTDLVGRAVDEATRLPPGLDLLVFACSPAHDLNVGRLRPGPAFLFPVGLRDCTLWVREIVSVEARLCLLDHRRRLFEGQPLLPSWADDPPLPAPGSSTVMQTRTVLTEISTTSSGQVSSSRMNGR